MRNLTGRGGSIVACRPVFLLLSGTTRLRYRRVLCRHRSVKFIAPGDELVVKFLRLVRQLRGEVVGLAEVIAKVVKLEVAVLKILLQPPVAGTNRARGRCAPGIRTRAEVTGEMPEDRVAAERALASAGQGLHVTHTVERIFLPP